jgi:hypothetical protein
MVHVSMRGMVLWHVQMREAQCCGACSWKKGNDEVPAAGRGAFSCKKGGDVEHVPARGTASWCMQLGEVQQYGTCSWEGGDNEVCAARWGVATWHA